MAEPESADQRALHELEADGDGHARASRARTRDIVPQGDATIIDITKRSRERIEKRYGQPIVEPPKRASTEEAPAWQEGLAALPQWRESPSLRAIWHDLIEGGRDIYEESGLPLAIGYYLIGIPGFAVACLAETVKLSAARPGRSTASLLVLLIVWSALVVAGLNPF